MDTDKQFSINTLGIVLSYSKYKESSKIVKVFTEKLGKISILARGAYNVKSNLLSVTQEFSLCEFTLIKGKSFYYIKDAKVINSKISIRDNFQRLMYGNFYNEIIDKNLYENEVNQKVFYLLEKTLNKLAKEDDNFLLLTLAFEIKFISLIGYRPNLIRCCECKSESFDKMYFSNEAGGLICYNCIEKYFQSYKISKKHIYLLNKLLYSPFEEIENINVQKKDLVEIQEILINYVKEKTEIKDYFSLKLLDW